MYFSTLELLLLYSKLYNFVQRCNNSCTLQGDNKQRLWEGWQCASKNTNRKDDTDVIPFSQHPLSNLNIVYHPCTVNVWLWEDWHCASKNTIGAERMILMLLPSANPRWKGVTPTINSKMIYKISRVMRKSICQTWILYIIHAPWMFDMRLRVF